MYFGVLLPQGGRMFTAILQCSARTIVVRAESFPELEEKINKEARKIFEGGFPHAIITVEWGRMRPGKTITNGNGSE